MGRYPWRWWVILLFIFVGHAMAQGVGVNGTGASPHPSAGLDVNFQNKGFLPPRLSTVQRDSIANPAPGLMIFNLDNLCMEYFRPTGWYSLCPKIPTVTTQPVSSILVVSAQSGGQVTDDGGATVVARGICYSTTPAPTLQDAFTTDGLGTGSFVSSLTGLQQGTTYYVRAYATNSAGTAYGNEISFTTLIPGPLVGGGTSLSGATFQASSVLYNTPSDAFDGSLSGYWHSAQYDKVPWANPWLRVNFPSARVVNRYRLWHRNSPTFEDRLNSWKIQGSNDGQNWVDLDVRTNSTPPFPGTSTFSQAQFGEYLFNNTTPYLHYRIFGTAGNPGHEYTVIGEWQLWGY